MNSTVYHVTRQQTGQFQWTANVSGDYRVCFSNQFSTITHKIVSFDFRIIDGDSADNAASVDIAATNVCVYVISRSIFPRLSSLSYTDP